MKPIIYFNSLNRNAYLKYCRNEMKINANKCDKKS